MLTLTALIKLNNHHAINFVYFLQQKQHYFNSTLTVHIFTHVLTTAIDTQSSSWAIEIPGQLPLVVHILKRKSTMLPPGGDIWPIAAASAAA